MDAMLSKNDENAPNFHECLPGRYLSPPRRRNGLYGYFFQCPWGTIQNFTSLFYEQRQTVDSLLIFWGKLYFAVPLRRCANFNFKGFLILLGKQITVARRRDCSKNIISMFEQIGTNQQFCHRTDSPTWKTIDGGTGKIRYCFTTCIRTILLSICAYKYRIASLATAGDSMVGRINHLCHHNLLSGCPVSMRRGGNQHRYWRSDRRPSHREMQCSIPLEYSKIAHYSLENTTSYVEKNA
jgi:hypothetical protein